MGQTIFNVVIGVFVFYCMSMISRLNRGLLECINVTKDAIDAHNKIFEVILNSAQEQKGNE